MTGPGAAAAPSRSRVVTSTLGLTLILSWGSTYYLLTVLAQPIARDTGWPLPGIVSGLSVGLLVSGLSAPRVGRIVQHRGGRPVLAAGSVLLALGLAGLAAAPSLPAFLAAWAVIGLGMAAGLYDAAFAVMGRLHGRAARGPITTLTLWGGLASTACWPLSAWLVEAEGWRVACLVYAALHLALGLPLHLLVVPSAPGPADRPREARRHGEAPPTPRGRPAVFPLLAATLTLTALISSTLSVHALALFQLRGLDLATAVALGALIGPAQVGARAVDLLVGRRMPPIRTLALSVALIAAGLGLLLLSMPLAALAMLLYGAGNGLHTIARGAVPLVLFDPDDYALVMGRLALPSLVVQALAPTVGAWLLIGNGTPMLASLVAVALAVLALVALLARHAGGRASL